VTVEIETMTKIMFRGGQSDESIVMTGIGRKATGVVGMERTDITRKGFEEIDSIGADVRSTITGMKAIAVVVKGTAVGTNVKTVNFTVQWFDFLVSQILFHSTSPPTRVRTKPIS